MSSTLLGKVAAALAACCALLALSTSNAFALGFSKAQGELTNTQAGAAGDAKFEIDFSGVSIPENGTEPGNVDPADPPTGDPNSRVRHMTLHLPPGLIGDPTGRPICSLTDFKTDVNPENPFNVEPACPADTQVGTLTVNIQGVTFTYNDGNNTTTISRLPISGDLGRLYLITPSAGEPARLGIWIKTMIGKPIRIQSPISVRPTDGALVSEIRDLPTEVESALNPGQILHLYLESVVVELWGDTSSHTTMPKPFMVNPTTCEPLEGSVSASTYGAPDDYVSAPMPVTTTLTTTLTGCDSVPFAPDLGTTATVTADKPNGFSVKITFPAFDPSGTVQSHLKDAVVKLPEGITMSPSVASDGLDGCSDAQFAPGTTAEPSCPALSELGTVKMVSPLLPDPLIGKVYLGHPQPGQQFRLLTYARWGNVAIKFVGVANPDPVTGQITATFSNLPRQPFTEFEMSFRGGDTAVLQAGTVCGTHNATATFTPYSGGSAVNKTSPVQTVDCADHGFHPSLHAVPNPALVGADSHLALTINRPDGQGRLHSFHLTLPPGQLGNLFAFPSCPIAQARAGACPAESRVGTATIASGVGNKPFAVQGSIHLIAPYDGGVGGLAVIVPVRVGPLDLGTIVSITKLTLRHGDLAIQAHTEPLPTMIAGIPLSIRTITLDINRSGFLVNGTSCAPHAAHATFTAVDGRTSTGQSIIQLAGCAGLPFTPRMVATLSGNPKNPELKVGLYGSRGQANPSRVVLRLPKELGVNLAAVQGGCTAEQLAANNCPESSVVGEVKATSPLLAEPLRGPVRLVQTAGQTLPSLQLDLRGFIHLPLLAVNEFRNGQVVATVDHIPDVPISSFEMTLKGGTKGLLAATNNTILCEKTPKVSATLAAHSGAQATSTDTEYALNCGVVVKRTTATLKGFGKGRTPSLNLKVQGVKLKSIRVTFPKQLRLNGKRFKKGARAVAGGKRVASNRIKRTKTTVTVNAPKATGALTLKLTKGALRRGKGLKIGKRITLKVRVTDSRNKARTINVRVTPRR